MILYQGICQNGETELIETRKVDLITLQFMNAKTKGFFKQKKLIQVQDSVISLLNNQNIVKDSIIVSLELQNNLLDTTLIKLVQVETKLIKNEKNLKKIKKQRNRTLWTSLILIVATLILK